MTITLPTQLPSAGLEPPPNEIAIDPQSDDLQCVACPAYELNLCAAITRNAGSRADQLSGAPFVASFHTVPARRTIRHPTEWSDHVPILCRGWATSSVALTDGSRQILSFLLPGDMFSTASLFEPTSNHLVEAITDVTYRRYKRSDFKAILFEYPDVLETLIKAWADEKSRADQLAIDLGRRTADERIARLILNLMNRLIKRDLAHDQAMEFPLRQHHIADATGLTPVHVSKVLTEFRRSGLIEISNRSLTIIDREEFRRVANMR